MSRNDGLLYTGKVVGPQTTAASIGIAKKREDSLQAKQEQKLKLLPAGELIVKMIELEKDKHLRIKNMDIEGTDPQKLYIELLANKKYLVYLDNFKQQVERILKSEEVKQGESFNE